MKPEAPEGIRGEFQPIATTRPRHPLLRAPSAPGGAGRSAGRRPVDVAPGGEPPGRRPPRADGPPLQPARGERPGPRRLARRLPLLRGGPRPACGRAATASPAAWPCRSGWSKARSPGRGRTPVSSAPGTTPGSSSSTRTSPKPGTTASPSPRGSTPDGCTGAATCSASRFVPAPATRSSTSRTPRWPCSATAQVGRALDIDREDPRLVDRYGRHLFGRSLLIARRLVEAGVPVVQATMGIVQTWDTHVGNFPRLRDSLLPPLDRAVSALLDDLDARGLLDETLVVMLGEFGRTPRIAPLEARRRAGPRPLAGRLPGGLRRRRGGRRPGDRQVRPPGGSRRLPRPSARPTSPRRSITPWASTRRPSCATAWAAPCGSARAR